MNHPRCGCVNQPRWATRAHPTHTQHDEQSHARGCGGRRFNPHPAPRAVVCLRAPPALLQPTLSTTGGRMHGVAESAAQPRPSTTSARITVDSVDRSARPTLPRQQPRITGGTGTMVSTGTAQRVGVQRAAVPSCLDRPDGLFRLQLPKSARSRRSAGTPCWAGTPMEPRMEHAP